MSTTILALPSGVFLLWISAFFFLVSSIIILKPLFETKEKLIQAFFAWLLGMGFLHIFMGAGFLWNMTILLHVGIFFGYTGSAYLLRIPLRGLFPRYEKVVFYIVLFIGWLIVAGMIVWPHSVKLMLWLLFSYMILVAGILPSFYLIWRGIKAKNKAVKAKGIGGGMGIFSCCLLADILVLSVFMNVAFWSEFFMALAPVILIIAVLYGRRLEKTEASKT